MKNSEFNKMWAGRCFKCSDTDVILVIPSDVRMGDWYSIGGGFIDVGDGLIYRVGGNVIEIKLGDENE